MKIEVLGGGGGAGLQRGLFNLAVVSPAFELSGCSDPDSPL